MSATSNPSRDNYGSVVDDDDSKLEEMKRQISQLKKDIRAKKRHENIDIGSNQGPTTEEKMDIKTAEETASVLEREMAGFLKGKRVILGKRKPNDVDQVKTMRVLETFKRKIGTVDKLEVPKKSKPIDSEQDFVCELHSVKGCRSCKDNFGTIKEEGNEEGWRQHLLVFEREAGDRNPLEDPNELVVIDPRKKVVHEDHKGSSNVLSRK